jgi:TonB family protein
MKNEAGRNATLGAAISTVVASGLLVISLGLCGCSPQKDSLPGKGDPGNSRTNASARIGPVSDEDISTLLRSSTGDASEVSSRGNWAARAMLSRAEPALPNDIEVPPGGITVLVSITVMPDGTVSNASLNHTSGDQRLDDAVIRAVKQWAFIPIEGTAPTSVMVSFLIPHQGQGGSP